MGWCENCDCACELNGSCCARCGYPVEVIPIEVLIDLIDGCDEADDDEGDHE
jgi:hypothetical protein